MLSQFTYLFYLFSGGGGWNGVIFLFIHVLNSRSRSLKRMLRSAVIRLLDVHVFLITVHKTTYRRRQSAQHLL